MKVPVDIDLSRASSTLCKLATKVGLAKRLGSGFCAGESNGPAVPVQIMERASIACANCDGDKEAILSRSCLIVLLSVSPVDSCFILLTSCET